MTHLHCVRDAYRAGAATESFTSVTRAVGNPGQNGQLQLGLVPGIGSFRKKLPDIRINAADPGYTATDLNANTGPQTVTVGTDAIVRHAPTELGMDPGASKVELSPPRPRTSPPRTSSG